MRDRAKHFRILAVVLFNAPLAYFSELEEIVTDKLICVPIWQEFVGRLNREWAEITLYVGELLSSMCIIP
jgi:hypothetical protein